jgi:uncharacterized protein (DUF1778 family)
MSNNRTRLPLDIKPDDRRLLESAAAVMGIKLAAWVRVAAVAHSREVLDELRENETSE